MEEDQNLIYFPAPVANPFCLLINLRFSILHPILAADGRIRFARLLENVGTVTLGPEGLLEEKNLSFECSFILDFFHGAHHV